MSTLSEFHTTQEPPVVTLQRFHQLLSKNNFDYGITWRWAGRCRHGVLEVYDVSLGPCDGVVESESFERNTQLWVETDTVLGRMHGGSPKHQALKALVARLQVRTV